MNKHLSGLALAAVFTTLAPEARAQRVDDSHPHALVLSGGPMLGVLGAGTYWRVNAELQLHKEDRYIGHALNLGIAFVPWPNEFGPSFTVAPRWQYDHQLVPGTLFFVSPYAGLELGLGVFDIFRGDAPRFAFVMAPMAGLDVKLILADRLLLGFRPIGVTVPMFIGGPSVAVDVIYDIALTVGVTL